MADIFRATVNMNSVKDRPLLSSQAIDFIKKHAVYVGIPEEKAERHNKSPKATNAEYENYRSMQNSYGAGLVAPPEVHTNAELLYLHTNGFIVSKPPRYIYTSARDGKKKDITVHIKHVPARPVIEPALRYDSERLSKMMSKAFQLASEKRFSEALAQLEKVGMRGQNVCREWFVNENNDWSSNHPDVAFVKWDKGADEPRPLIDTGELRKSITYVIEPE